MMAPMNHGRSNRPVHPFAPLWIRRLTRVVICAIFLPLCAFLPQDPPDREKKKPAVSRFAQRYLVETELAAEVKVIKIIHLGMGVDVVTLDLKRTVLDRLPKGMAGKKTHLLLAHRDEFVEGTKLFLLLKRYGSGDRLTSLHRLSSVEKNYDEKVGLIEQYIAVEQIKGRKERIRAFAALVLKNLNIETSWTRWNSIYELNGLLEGEDYDFTTGDVSYIEHLLKDEKDEGFRDALDQACGVMASRARAGPPLVEIPREEEKEKDSATEKRHPEKNNKDHEGT